MRNWLLAVSVLALGCGDNSRTCGTGTKVEDGVCVPSLTCGAGTIADEETGDCVADGTHVCTNGTRFDPETSTCQIDPSACQNGTVLIGGACVDPTTDTLVDLVEGPEPNGLGVVEASASQAGNITVKPTGAFVVRGTIAPHGDAPDVDTYVVHVDMPTLLEISADGVGGVAAGFAAGDGVDPDDWWRYGIDLGSDTSRRKVYLRDAGDYLIAVGDVRTLFDRATTAAPSGAGGTGAYYLSVSAVALPAATAVSVPSTATASLANGEVAFYQATFPSGMHRVSVAMPSELAVGAVATADGHSAEVDGQPAEVAVNVAGSRLIAVDAQFALGTGPVAFTLAIQ
ncbi:MAG: hypothetical protein HOV81_44440 [Kofleriaceae bacterium]|nr:hypothetical protein [Kofleriaceae bacterium]